MKLAKDFTVLVTRPEAAGKELCKQLNLEQCHSIYFPTIAFAPSSLTPQSIVDQQYDMIIFISPQAVIASLSYLPKSFIKTKVVAVGGGTQSTLCAHGYQVDFIPAESWGSEGVLKLPIMQQLANKKVLVVRGEGGRELLAETLQMRGARIDHLIVYQRILPEHDPTPIYDLMKNNLIHAIVCTSNTAIHNLLRLLPNSAEELKALPLIVVSERIKSFAVAQGFQSIRVAENASHESIIKIVLQIRNKLCQKN